MSLLPKQPTLLLPLLLGACLAAPPAARAQGNTSSLEDLKKQFESNPERQRRFADLLNGNKQPTAEDQALLRAAAQWYVFRLQVPTFRLQPEKLFRDVVKPFEGNLVAMRTNTAKNKEFQKRLTKELLGCLREVLDKNAGEYQVLVNAAQMLPPLARGSQEEVGDFLAELVRDPKRHDAVKLYALRGLGEFFRVLPPEAGILAQEDKKDRDANRIQAVIEFLNRKTPVAPGTPPEQVEAIRYVRREAIRALGQLHVPAVEVEAKINKVRAPVAAALMGVMAAKNGGMEPPPSLTEQFEAAVALCQLQGKRIEEYDQTLPLHFLALFLADYGEGYNTDRLNIVLPGQARGDKVGALYPWKIMTRRLKDGLKDLVANSLTAPANAKAKELAEKSALLLNFVDQQKQAVDAALITSLRDFAQAVAPKTKSAPVYRQIKGIEVPIE